MKTMTRALLLAASLALSIPAAGAPSALDLAYEEVVAASAELKRAEAALEQGSEPLPGERTAIAGKKRRSRLNEQYAARQEELQRDVDAARKRLDEALARWNALK